MYYLVLDFEAGSVDIPVLGHLHDPVVSSVFFFLDNDPIMQLSSLCLFTWNLAN